MLTMTTGDPIPNHPEYARAYLHYSQHGSSPEDAARLAYEHTQKQLAAAPARQPTSTRKVFLILGVVILGSIGFVALAAVIARSPDGTDDVDITSCNSDGERTFHTGLKITNSTSSSKSYSIKVEFVDGSGNRVGDGRAFISDLAAGQSATETLTGFKSAGGSTCQLVDVNRY